MTTGRAPRDGSPDRSVRLARWLDRRRIAVLVAAGALAVVSAAVASRLPIHADFSHLLPPDARSVQDLRAIETRVRVFGTAIVGVASDDPAARARAAERLRGAIARLPPDLVSSVTADDAPARRFAWEHRFLFAPLDDLRAARDALAARIEEAKLEANPLYVDLEDEPGDDRRDAVAGDDPAAALRAKLREAEAARDRPAALLTKDGRLQILIVRTPFPSSDTRRGGRLVAAIEAAIAEVERAEPGVDAGLTGDVPTTIEEHRTILAGMVIATVLTVTIVAAALLAYYRAAIAVGALLGALAVGALATFAFTKLAIGHLNLATAFLSSIVVGNGINFGIMLLARHLEERRAGREGPDAIAAAMRGTIRGTLTAALTAAVAYGSLVVTDFRGFRHFGVIGGVGILLCWLTAYTVLPAALSVLERRRRIRPRPEPAIGRALARLAPGRPAVVAAVMLVVTAAAGLMTWRFLGGDPYEKDFRRLRSSNGKILEYRWWMREIDRGFGHGISGRFVIAAPDRKAARRIAATLRALDEGKPEKERLFRGIATLDDALPADQDAKLALLAEIRALLREENVAELAPEDRADAVRLRPPPALRPLGPDDVPRELAWPYTERDGTRGRLVLVGPGTAVDGWNADSLVAFAARVRALDLGPDARIGGPLFVFADVVRALETDGPRATMAALLGSLLVVTLTLGLRLHGLVTLAAGASGTLLMLAAAWALGLRVNFLDFVALPITIGIGIDYAANLAARARLEGAGHVRHVLATTGGAVFLSSFTTIVGYASLLLSANQGIRSFGGAAILGEATCLIAAFLLTPALLALRRPDPAPAQGQLERG